MGAPLGAPVELKQAGLGEGKRLALANDEMIDQSDIDPTEQGGQFGSQRAIRITGRCVT